METLKIKINGTGSLLMNNPQSVNVFNKYAKAKSIITGKKKKTDEDSMELQRLDIESKIYMDEILGIFVPTSWVMAALAQTSFKRVKISKKEIRSGVFMDETKVKLYYEGMNKVKTKADISGDQFFYHTMLLKQGQNKLAKSTPVFNNWHFSTGLTFDPSVIDRSTLINILKYCCNYGGFGDFRPTYGRADLEIIK